MVSLIHVPQHTQNQIVKVYDANNLEFVLSYEILINVAQCHYGCPEEGFVTQFFYTGSFNDKKERVKFVHAAKKFIMLHFIVERMRLIMNHARRS